MSKSGLADSPFFTAPQKKREAASRSLDKSPTPIKRGTKKDKVAKRSRKLPATKQPSNRDTMTPRNHDTTVSRYHDTIIEVVRKAVKELGKEAATHRFTPEEKKTIADILYAYNNRGLRTSENEITRIAVNFIIQDYKENGERSILDKTLKALNE
jgi:hypothetical protein